MEMKAQKITYGVYNLIEWYAALKVGEVNLKVAFTGGATTTQGVTPATYTTSDPVVQLAIESSSQYIEGRIKRVRVYDLGQTVKVERNSKRSDIEHAAVTSAPGPVEIPMQATALSESEVSEISDGDHDKPVVKVTCLNDAQVYLREHYGIPTSKIRSKVAAMEMAEQYGLVFEFIIAKETVDTED